MRCTQSTLWKRTKVYALPKEAEREKWAALLASYREKELAKFGDFGQRIKQAAEEANKCGVMNEILR
jgi:hypothetical protein